MNLRLISRHLFHVPHQAARRISPERNGIHTFFLAFGKIPTTEIRDPCKRLLKKVLRDANLIFYQKTNISPCLIMQLRRSVLIC